MMKRTTIMLPATLKRKAEAEAKRSRISLGSFIRQSIEQSLKSNGSRSEDPLFHNIDDLIFTDDGPPDVAENHDKYLTKLLWEEYERKQRDWKRGRR